MKYIKLYENFENNIKTDLLSEYLEIKPTQISQTDNYIYDTFSKDGNETYLIIKKSELDIMTQNEMDQYIFNLLDFNDIDLLRIIINNLGIKMIDYMHDFDVFCEEEYKTYSNSIKHPDADALHLLSNSTKEDTQKYADAFLKKDPNFVMHHINWLMEYDYSYNNDNVKDFFSETFDTTRLLNDNKYDMVFKFLIYRCQQNKEERKKGSRNISTFIKYHSTPIFMFRISSEIVESNKNVVIYDPNKIYEENPKVLTYHKMIDYLSTFELYDSNGELDFNDIKEIVGASMEWKLTIIPTSDICDWIFEKPYKTNINIPPIAIKNLDGTYEILDGKTRMGYLNYIGVDKICVYIGNS